MKEPDVTIEERPEEPDQTQIEVRKAESTEEPTGRVETAIDDLAASVREFAAKIPESISKAVERALAGRDFPLMVRVNDEALKRIDQLVETGIFKSRSESAAFLISEGIKAQAALFERIESKIKEIEKLRQELKHIIQEEMPPQ